MSGSFEEAATVEFHCDVATGKHDAGIGCDCEPPEIVKGGQDARIIAGVLLAAPGSGKHLAEHAARTFPFMHTDLSSMRTPTLLVVGAMTWAGFRHAVPIEGATPTIPAGAEAVTLAA